MDYDIIPGKRWTWRIDNCYLTYYINSNNNQWERVDIIRENQLDTLYVDGKLQKTNVNMVNKSRSLGLSIF